MSKENADKKTDKAEQIKNDDIEFEVPSDLHLLIPEGEYEGCYCGHEKKRFFGETKLYVKIRITSAGESAGIVLFRPYTFYKPLTRGCALFKDLVLIYGKRPSKSTKLSLSLFKGKVIKFRVRTVEKNFRQAPLLEHQKYSVISEILDVAAGGDAI